MLDEVVDALGNRVGLGAHVLGVGEFFGFCGVGEKAAFYEHCWHAFVFTKHVVVAWVAASRGSLGALYHGIKNSIGKLF